jgi:hypothetical protein
MTSEPVDELLLRNPELRRTLADHGGTWMLLRGGVLNIYGELDRADAERIGAQAKLELIQFGRKFDVSNATLQLVNDPVLAQHPQASLSETLNGFGAFEDLGFLAHLPRLRSLGIGGNHAIDLRPIRSHGALEHLRVGGLGTSLSPLQGYERLRSFAFGERIKHHEAVGTFTNLERLTINGQNLKSLAFLKPLQSLRSLSFVLGGTRRFADLTDLPRLDELSIWRTRKVEIDDLLPLNQINSLRRLVLRELPRITSLDWLTNSSLHVLELEKMKGLRSYASLAGPPSLKTLILRDEVTEAHIVELARLGSLNEVYVYDHYRSELRAAVDARSLPIAIKAISFGQGEVPPSDTTAADYDP